MKLIRCHIENFGKLSNFDYEFQEGLNTIKKENGFGKTTFADFIKAMFYGLEAKRNTKVLIDRKKYDPWQNGAFGGNIEFEINGKQYKIERFFGKKEADDTFKIYDLSTNLETEDFSQYIGEEIFKLNKEAFERSTFISGQNIETSMNDSISAKLGNILENENDINSSDKALSLLEEAIKNYKKTGGRGEINEKILERTKLEKKLEQSKIDEKTLEARKFQNEKISQEISSKNQEQESLSQALSNKIKEEAKKAKIEQYEILKNNVEESKKNIDNYKESISKDNELNEKIEVSQKKYESLKHEVLVLDAKMKMVKKINIMLLITFIVLAVVGSILLLKANKILAVTLFILAAIDLVIFIVKSSSYNKKKNNYFSKEQEQKNTEKLIETLNSLYQKQIENNVREMERLKNEYEEKLKMVDSYEKENSIEELTEHVETLDNIDKEELENKIKILNEEIGKLNDEKNYNKNQIEILESNLDTVFDVENELEELNQKIDEMKEKCSVLEKTKKYLAEAKEQFSSHYLSDMKESFIKNLKLLNGTEMEANIDINLDVQVNEQGSNKEIRYFSTGYKDLIYICMRLSLIEALFEEEKPFIVLDDPFVNLDEDKIENAMNLVKNISKEYQVIYFVCHESREL